MASTALYTIQQFETGSLMPIQFFMFTISYQQQYIFYNNLKLSVNCQYQFVLYNMASAALYTIKQFETGSEIPIPFFVCNIASTAVHTIQQFETGS